MNTPTSSPLLIDLTYLRKPNYALQQNRIPIVRQIQLHHEGECDLKNVCVKLELYDEIATSCERRFEVIPTGSSLIIHDLSPKLTAAYLSQLTERVNTEMRLSITAEGEMICDEHYPLEILAFDQWGGVSEHPELLAAFITPNHPSIASVLRRASQILEEWGEDAALDAYLSHSSDRVRKQMAALFQSASEYEISYCIHPASYEERGQRVRLADACFSQKLGNCLDMSLLYAACLEAAGINPIIIITKGHAFIGAWLVDQMLTDSVNDDISVLTKRLASGINEIALAECTMMNMGHTQPFDIASKAAEDHLIDTENFLCSLDVKRCRLSHIKPLPQRVMGHEGFTLEEAPPSPLCMRAPSAIAPLSELLQLDKGEATKQKVWERKLLDLSLRNNLLNARISRSSIQLMAANLNEWEDKFSSGEQFSLLEKPSDWTARKSDEESTRALFSSIAQSDPILPLLQEQLKQNRLHSYLTEYELDKTLTYLYRQARLSLEENGANTLYLALGMLRWYETPRSERPRFAPLLLMPVEIKRKSSKSGYSIKAVEEETMMNITLLEMLKQDFGIDIGSLIELPRDLSGVDVKLVFNSLRSTIMGQPRWDVEEKALLGIFSFSKFIMWNDINQHADKLCRNSIVHSLVTARYQEEDKEEKEKQEALPLDTDIPLPIPADAYQREAIALAAQGNSFILHGPPGSGKSQTITNMIAHALYQGKKVLFVAEKMAALTVVQDRLEKIGLAPFCLELHSNKSTKSAVLRQLQETTELAISGKTNIFAREAERLRGYRDELALPIEKLHRPFPLGISLYDALFQWQHAELEYSLADLHTASQLAEEEWYDIQHDLEKLQKLAQFCGELATHPLKLIGLTRTLPSTKQELSEGCAELAELAAHLQATLKAVAELLPCDTDTVSAEQVSQIASIATKLQDVDIQPPSSLLRYEALGELQEQLKLLIPLGEARDSMRAKILQICRDRILTLDCVAYEERWYQNEQKWFIPRFFAQRAQRKELAALHKSGSVSADEVLPLLAQVKEYQDKQKQIMTYQDYFRYAFGVLGELENPETVSWDGMQKALDEVMQLSHELIKLTKKHELALSCRQKLADAMVQGKASFLSLYGEMLDEFHVSWKKYQDSEATLREKAQLRSGFLSEGSLTQWQAEWTKLATHIDRLRDWTLWNDGKAQCTSPLLHEYIAWLETHKADLDQLSSRFKLAIYRNLIDYCLENEPSLMQFRGTLFEESITRFRELCKRHEDLTRQEIVQQLASQLPSTQGRNSQHSELGILLRSIRSRGRGMSIRQLFDQIPDLLPRLKPCMLMSPLSVAQFLDLDHLQYDLVIFDEASQMPTSEAVGAMARGKHVIVVGDPKQMPPTSFFSTGAVDEDNLELEDLESILDDCQALAMPSRYLRWHYRSKHESLIAFSNTKYYDNSLLTYPSPDDLSHKVTYEHVEGYYDKGKSRQNVAEANAIVAEVLRRLRDPQLRQLSIGIVTFSQVQQNLIEDKLQDIFALPENRELEVLAYESEESLFVKNLENVQGDERDVILFSIAYGPDQQGKISLNFGPLNREGGWRRLNVAVSRARYEMKVFSTLKADQIDLARSSAEGVAGLKAFLEFAQKGRSALPVARKEDLIREVSLIDSIADKLREKGGYEIDTHVGSSGYRIDMAVRHPDKESVYLASIICDGEQYALHSSLRDREVTQPAVLKILGWDILRFWVMDWVHEPEQTVDRLLKALDERRQRADSSPDQMRMEAEQAEDLQKEPTPEPVLAPAPAPAPTAASLNPYLRPYELAELGIHSEDSNDITEIRFRPLVLQQITSILSTEAPIHSEHLVRRMLTQWGVTRMTTRIKDFFAQIFAHMGVASTTQRDGATILWDAEQSPEDYRSYRLPLHEEIEYVPIIELAVLARAIVEQQMSLPRVELQREMIYALGYSKMGKKLLQMSDVGIREAIALNLLQEEEGRIRLSD